MASNSYIDPKYENIDANKYSFDMRTTQDSWFGKRKNLLSKCILGKGKNANISQDDKFEEFSSSQLRDPFDGTSSFRSSNGMSSTKLKKRSSIQHKLTEPHTPKLRTAQ